MNHPIAVCSPLIFININNFKTAVWYLDWFSGCWWYRFHAVRWWDPVCWEGNRNLVPENVVDNVIDSRGETTIAFCNNYTLNKVIMLFMYQVDCYTVLLWWLYECLGEGGGMGHDHQLAGIKLLWLAGLNIGWRMPLSQCIQCVQIGLKPLQNWYIYIYKSCKSDMGKNKSLQSSYIFSLRGATNR